MTPSKSEARLGGHALVVQFLIERKLQYASIRVLFNTVTQQVDACSSLADEWT